MELAYEMPTKYLKDLDKHNDYNFALAHLTCGEEYLTHYRESNKYTICDNSAFELAQPLAAPEIIKAATLLKAQEIVAPDVFKNGYKTVKSVNTFIKYLEQEGKLGKFKIMAVIQGRTAPDWSLCFNELSNNKHVDVIGMSYVGCEVFDPDRANARIGAVRIATNPSAGALAKQIHLLGMGGNPLEIVAQRDVPNVRSIDTSMPIVQGLAKNRFNEGTGLVGAKLPRPNNYFDASIDKEQMNAVIHNFDLMKKWATK